MGRPEPHPARLAPRARMEVRPRPGSCNRGRGSLYLRRTLEDARGARAPGLRGAGRPRRRAARARRGRGRLEQTAGALRQGGGELAKEVALFRNDEVAGSPAPGDLEAADDRAGDAVRLAHHELGGAGDLVGDGDHRVVELVAGTVAPPA